MFRRHALLVVVALLLGLMTARASADVTVLYAPPGPRAPLVASVVPRSEASGTLEPASSEPSERTPIPPAPSERSEPAPIATVREPAPSEPGTERPHAEAAPVGPAGVEPVATSARPPSGDRRVRMIRGDGEDREEVEIVLVDSEGQPDPAGLEALSILARPPGAARPSAEELASHRDDLGWVASSLRRLHPALLLRLEQIRRAYPGRTIELISGLRSDGAESSRHRSGRALDLRVAGVPSAELDALLRSMPETGVGLCPASDLVHLDIRAQSAHWIDLHP